MAAILLWPPTLRQNGLPTQNLNTHTHTHMKGFLIYIMRLSGESEAAPKQVQKWLERTGKGDWLGGFMVVRGEGQVDGAA